MKVVLISHTCMSQRAGQPKLHCLAKFPDIELTVLVPDRMFTYGKWSQAEPPLDAAFRYQVGRTRWHYVAKQWYLMHYAEGLRETLRETKPDLVDIWEEPWGALCAQAVYWTKRLCPQARIVVETEQNIYKRLPPPFQQFQNYSLRYADFAVGRNQESLEVLRKKGYAGPAQVVGNAVDPELFRPMDRDACRATLGLSGFIVGYIGRLVESKGLGDLVAALPHCPPETRLLLVGSGAYREALERQAEALQVADRVQFIENRPLAELPQIMNALDVLALPSHTTASWKEQFGRVLIEAHACRVPVLGSDSGAIPEVIGAGGLVAPERQPLALAQAIATLAADPTLRRTMGERGYAQAMERYTWAQVAAQMRDIYLRVLAEKTVSRPVPGMIVEDR